MEVKKIIFVDFENIAKITANMKKADAKIIVLVGANQDKRASDFAKELLDLVSSIELIKVKGKGKNALDFFIAYYLGFYISRNKELEFMICSKDEGYDPLIKYLKNSGINIQRENDLFETDEDYKKAFDYIKGMPNRPKKLTGLENNLKTLFKEENKKEKIKKIIDDLINCEYIEEIGDGKIKYNI